MRGKYGAVSESFLEQGHKLGLCNLSYSIEIARSLLIDRVKKESRDAPVFIIEN